MTRNERITTPEEAPKARSLASGIEVWCSFEKLVAIEELSPNPRNPNTHPQRQIELLAKNIQHFGWRHPVTVSRRSGQIVSGHGRLMAAKHLGLQIVPVDFQDFTDENEELAVLVADNRLAELSSVDLNELEKIANSWKTDNFDTLLAGFEPLDLEALLNPKSNAPKDDGGKHEKELEKGDVGISIGLYRFSVSQEDFFAWLDGIKQESGFDKASVTKAIRDRLGL